MINYLPNISWYTEFSLTGISLRTSFILHVWGLKIDISPASKMEE